MTTQGAPPPEQPAGEAPEEEEEAGRGPEVAQEIPGEEAPLAPVAEQRKLAKTGLNPALIALLGAFSLGGGIFLFRRALAR